MTLGMDWREIGKRVRRSSLESLFVLFVGPFQGSRETRNLLSRSSSLLYRFSGILLVEAPDLLEARGRGLAHLPAKHNHGEIDQHKIDLQSPQL